MAASDNPSLLTGKSLDQQQQQQRQQQQQQQQQAEQNRVTQQHLLYLQAPFDLNSPPYSGLPDQVQMQQQQQQHGNQRPQNTPTASANLSTPEAHWSASSNFSSAPALTLSR
ncbi:hypothetical protein CBS101457_005799 [Exobasidium rhododendri]|nr:hypothetical protein CBS101457_005799 [Exobasidium rhododendri]